MYVRIINHFNIYENMLKFTNNRGIFSLIYIYIIAYTVSFYCLLVITLFKFIILYYAYNMEKYL